MIVCARGLFFLVMRSFGFNQILFPFVYFGTFLYGICFNLATLQRGLLFRVLWHFCCFLQKTRSFCANRPRNGCCFVAVVVAQ